MTGAWNARHGMKLLISVSYLVLLTSADAGRLTDFDYQGAVLKSRTADCEEYQKPDGLRISKCKSQEKAFFPDGTVITRLPDGTREILSPDKSRLTITSDGTRIYKDGNGNEKVISMDGMTPFGEQIERIEKKLGNKNAAISICFAADRSDEHLRPTVFKDPEASKLPVKHGVSRLFDEMINACALRVKSETNKERPSATVVISQCRYCRTGYCKRKNVKGVFIEISNGKTAALMNSLSLSEVEDPQTRKLIVEKALGYIFD